MRRTRIAVLSAATTVAALGISGCAGGERSQLSAAQVPEPPALAAPPADAAPLPASEALADVLYRLADTAVPAADKLTVVDNTTPADTAALDGFGTALRDGGFTPITVTATDVRWSDTRSGNVLTTITITTTDPDDPGEFAFPMEFQPAAGGWQLTRETADFLLVFGDARSGPATGSPQPVPGR